MRKDEVFIEPQELRVGDVLVSPHLSASDGVVTKVTPTSYGVSVLYVYEGEVCGGGIFERVKIRPRKET